VQVAQGLEPVVAARSRQQRHQQLGGRGGVARGTVARAIQNALVAVLSGQSTAEEATLDLIDIGPVRISPGLAADVIVSNTSIAGANVAEDLDGTIPVPMLFVQGEVDFSILECVVDLGWLDGSYDIYSGKVLDVEAMLRVKPLAMLQVFVGYRATLVDITRDESGNSDRIDLDFRGWTAGVGLQF